MKETAVFTWLQSHRHPNLITVHSLVKAVSPRTNRPVLELTTDFYPMNLIQFSAQSHLDESRARIKRKIILFQVVKGLHYLHSHGVFHRDLCPSSVLVGDKLEVVLTHFSAAQGRGIPDSNEYTCSRLARPP